MHLLYLSLIVLAQKYLLIQTHTDVPTIAPRTYGDYNGNALPIIGDAFHTVGKGAIDLVTTGGTGYELIGKVLTGKEITLVMNLMIT